MHLWWGGGGGEEQVHNVEYDLVPVMNLLWHCCNLLSRGNKYVFSFQVLLVQFRFTDL
jgi:hypothetical protein